MTRRIRKSERRGILVLIFVLLASACGANESILRSGKETPAPSDANSEKTPFAKDLEAVQTADFTFVYVLRRKDGGTIDAEDKGVIKLNTDGIPRRVAADENRAFILGSNAPIPPKNLMALYDRFAVENYSQAPTDAVNTNANTKK